jgi:hypothetical protein
METKRIASRRYATASQTRSADQHRQNRGRARFWNRNATVKKELHSIKHGLPDRFAQVTSENIAFFKMNPAVQT